MDLPIKFITILTICSVGIFIISISLEPKEVLLYSVFIYGIFSIHINDNSFTKSFWSITTCILYLLLTYLILYFFSGLKNFDNKTNLLLFSFPFYWTVVTFIGNIYSRKKFSKVLNFVYFFRKSRIISKGRVITGLDFIYTVVGFFTIIIWGANVLPIK